MGNKPQFVARMHLAAHSAAPVTVAALVALGEAAARALGAESAAAAPERAPEGGHPPFRAPATASPPSMSGSSQNSKVSG